MDLSQATGAVEVIDLDGEPRRVRPLTMREWGEVTAWLKRVNPSPVTRAALAIQEAAAAGAPLDAATRDQMLDHAQRAALAWPPRTGSAEWFDTIDRVEGGWAKLIYEVLSKADPTFTPERAEALVGRLGFEDLSELIRVAYYGLHPSKKATSPGPAPSPSATTGAP